MKKRRFEKRKKLVIRRFWSVKGLRLRTDNKKRLIEGYKKRCSESQLIFGQVKC